MKILVVDDSALMRKLIVRSLRSVEGADVEIVEATDGMEALAVIQQHGRSIELIFCDMNMPNVNGLSLLRSLRGSPEFRQIPFVIVTADESSESTAQALREGAAGVISKPFRPEAIADFVRRRRSGGRRATSSVFKTDVIAKMIRTMSRPVRHGEKDAHPNDRSQEVRTVPGRDVQKTQAEARESGRDVPGLLAIVAEMNNVVAGIAGHAHLLASEHEPLTVSKVSRCVGRYKALAQRLQGELEASSGPRDASAIPRKCE